MTLNWPKSEVVQVPRVQSKGARLRVGIVMNQSRWSSTKVSGWVSGSVYNGTGGVTGRTTSKVTDHQRVFVHFPEDGSEAAFEFDDWDFDVRQGHALVIASTPQGRRSQRPWLAYCIQTGAIGPRPPCESARGQV